MVFSLNVSEMKEGGNPLTSLCTFSLSTLGTGWGWWCWGSLLYLLWLAVVEQRCLGGGWKREKKSNWDLEGSCRCLGPLARTLVATLLQLTSDRLSPPFTVNVLVSELLRQDGEAGVEPPLLGLFTQKRNVLMPKKIIKVTFFSTYS